MSSNSPEEIKVPKWAVTVVGVLIVLLVLQSGAFFYYVFSKDKTKESKPVVLHEQYTSPASAMQSKTAQAHRPMQQTYASQSAWSDPFADDPFDAMSRLQQRMNRLFDSLLTYGPPLAGSLGPTDAFDFMPTIDLQDKDKNYVVTVDLPGLEKDKIDISVQGNILTIQGVRKSESESKDPNKGFYAQERRYGSFARSVTLPGPVDESKIKAEYDNGVLTITLPKVPAELATKKIDVV